MPTLSNSRHEAFAQARAKGSALENAYEDAGFTPGNGHASRLAVQPAVAERIAEFRVLQTELDDSRTQAVIAAMLRVAKASEAEATPAALREIRLTLMEVNRLRNEMESERRVERISIRRGE